jgi:hypothetical protein
MKEVDFSGATFKEKASFWGSEGNRIFGSWAWAWFSDSRIEKPEQFTFNRVLLRPGWFINADVRKVDFTDVKWEGISKEVEDFKRRVENVSRRAKGATEALGKRELRQAWRKLTASALDIEIKELDQRNVESPYTLLAQTCRRLSANAEENREYPLANEFHYWSMNALRKEGWSRLGLIGTLYWALSGYGVRAARAFWILVSIWLAFTALYFLMVESSPFWVCSASDIWQGIDFAGQAAVYSLSALVRLNPRPQSEYLDWFQTLVTIEGILGPLQIALLALAVRCKVMR